MVQSELLDHTDRVRIRPEDVVVELLEPDPRRRLEACRQAPRQRFSLDYRHAVAGTPAAHRGGQAEGASAKHGGADRQDVASSGIWRLYGRTRASLVRGLIPPPTTGRTIGGEA